jgi:hypothetical protein
MLKYNIIERYVHTFRKTWDNRPSLILKKNCVTFFLVNYLADLFHNVIIPQEMMAMWASQCANGSRINF